MTTISGAGPKLKSKNSAKHRASGIAPAEIADQESRAIQFISGDFIFSALDNARSKSPDEFRKEQQAWLLTHLAPMKTATELLYELAARQHGIETADAALQGALLGGETIRLAIQAEATTQRSSLDNLASWGIGMRGIVYDEGIEDEKLGMFLRPDAVEAMLEVRSHVARTTATMVISLCGEPKPGVVI